MHAVRRLVRPAALLAVAAALVAAVPAASAAPLQLHAGAALSLTGDAAAYGLSTRRGIDMAVEEINDGGVPGVRMDVSTIDDMSTDAGAAIAFGVFFRRGVAAIMGPTLSSVALNIDPFAQGARLPVLAVSNTQPGISEIGSFIFRPALTEEYVLPRVVRAVARSPLAPKTAVVIQGSDSFAATSGPLLVSALSGNGLTVLATELVAPGTTDYSAIADDVVAKDPDIVAISALAPEAVPLLKALRTAGYRKAVIGSNGLNSLAVTKGAGSAANKLITGTAWAGWNATKANKRFVKAFRRKYHTSPDQFAATGYAYTYVLATAAVRGGTATADGIRQALAGIVPGKGVKTLLGGFAFTAGRDGRSPVLVQQFRSGRWHAFNPS